MGEDDRVERGQEPHRRAHVALDPRRARKVKSEPVAEVAEALERRVDLADLKARELLHVFARRGAVGREVAADDPRALSCASGSGSRQRTNGDGFVCGHAPIGAVRTNGSTR